MKKIMTVLLVIMLALLGLSVYSYLTDGQRAAAQATPTPTAVSTPTPTAVPKPTPDFTSPDSLLIVANKTHRLPEGYVPEDLTWSVDCGTGACYMREPAAIALQGMFAAASNDGVNLTLLSAYRSEEYQAQLYNGYVASYGTERADRISSRPGYSDHQTGLAADIGSSVNPAADLNAEEFKATDEGQWLYQHAHEYGFIERYPDGKEEITGYGFESWHFRYVGTDIASAIYAVDPDETFEEYFNVSGGTAYAE
ncbi:MAG: D-alanyl-D-alanine carboxypeptidase family protein [Erysipelotrichia bacterium]|nr:D-alanyl-D-alanine carboxypeptidase family protein [Erysipelotrichia bacterium]